MALKAHTLGSWKKDDTNHWRVCTVCKGEFEKAKHEYKNGECICGKQQNQIPQTKADLLTIGDSTTIEVGDKTTLWAMVGTVRVGNSAITWRSADITIATVSSAGTVTGAKAGSVAIIGTYEGKTAYCNITVKAKRTTVDSISLNYSNLTIDSGNSATLKATIKPTGYTGGVTWKLINVNPNRPGDDFISMSNGSISTRAGSSGGTARVTATAGTLTAYCDVTVKAKTVTATKTVKSITLNKSSVTLGYGNTEQITATVKYSDGSTDGNVTWKSKDTSIASVNNGTITAKGTGDQVYTNKTNITVTSNFDSKVTKTITVTVKKCSAIYTVSGHETYIDSVYEKDTDKYHKVNKVCSRCGTEWVSKKEVHNKKAIPNNDETHYEWCGCGYSGTVKHTWKNGKCSVCETKKEEKTKVTGMRFEETNIKVNAGRSIRIQPILEPSGAKNQSVVWSTSASGFATVKNGLITTNKDAGGNTVYIDAYLEDNPSIKARCTLNIVTPVKMVKISGEKEVEVGKTIQLKAEVTPDNASDKKVVWESNNAGVATVNASGVVTGVTAGKGATIKATAGGRSSTYYIKVVDKKVAVTGISVDDAIVTAGSNVTLKAAITPSNADNKKVSWSIVSTEIGAGNVIVDKEKGKITVSKESTGGNVKVQAVTEDGGYKATCTVSVRPKINKVTIVSESGSKQVEEDGKLKLKLVVDPDTIKVDDVKWTSKNELVATVDANGVVTGKSSKINNGTVVIYGGSETLGRRLSFSIKVVSGKIEETKVTGMRFEETNMMVNVGGSIRIQPILEPSGAKKQSIVWSTSGSASGFATVKNGLVTTNKDAGGNTVYIDAYLEDNPSIKARCTLNIVTPVKMVKISGEKEVEVGKTIQLKADVMPDNASDKKVVWESNNAGVATVDANGVVTGIIAGKRATKKATAGGRSSTYYIKVVDKKVAVTGVSVVDAIVTAGSSGTLKATITPSNADNKKVSWSIVSSEIETGSVSVDKEKGRITVSKEATGGKVIVQATTEDGGYTATCTVTVKPKVNKFIITSDSKKVEVGGILKLEVKIEPETIKANDIIWSSRNESVAEVDKNGNV